MKKIKNIYFYLFYKFYKHFEKGPSVWMSEWKASLAMDLLIGLITLILIVYYKIFIDRSISLDHDNLALYVYTIGFFTIVLPHYYIFNHKDKWKDIIVQFDQLSKEKNMIRGWLVFVFISLLLFLLIYGFYLMSTIDWSQHKI
jgi:hypothetical protein